MEERNPHEHYSGFIEPRQLSLDRDLKDARIPPSPPSIREGMGHLPPMDTHEREQERLARAYAGMEHMKYPPPPGVGGRFGGPTEFTAHGSRGDAFLWSGDYGHSTIPGGPNDHHPLPFDDWGARPEGRHHIGTSLTNFALSFMYLIYRTTP